MGTSPPRGGRAVIGQMVTILVSNGSDFVPGAAAHRHRRRCPSPEPEPPVMPPPQEGAPTLPGRPGPPEPGEDLVVPAWPPRGPRGAAADRRPRSSSSDCVSSHPTSTTRCSRNSHRPTATTPPTTVSPPKGAPRSSGRARNSTKPWRKPDRQAAVNAAPSTRADQPHPAAADHPEPPGQRQRERGQHPVEADRDAADGGQDAAVPGQVGHHRDGEQQRVQQHRGHDQHGQRRQPAAPAGHPLASAAEPEQRAPQPLAVERHRQEGEQALQQAQPDAGLHQAGHGVRGAQLGRQQLGQPVAQLASRGPATSGGRSARTPGPAAGRRRSRRRRSARPRSGRGRVPRAGERTPAVSSGTAARTAAVQPGGQRRRRSSPSMSPARRPRRAPSVRRPQEIVTAPEKPSTRAVPSAATVTSIRSSPTRSPVARTAPSGAGLVGRSSSRPAGTSGRSPSTAESTATEDAAAHACGRQDAG